MSITKPRRLQDSAPDLDILGDQVTIHPAGYVEPPATGREGQERNVVEHMVRFRESPFDFLREVSLHVSGSGWRAYEDVIGQPIFYNGFTDFMKNAIMQTPMLKKRIEELAGKRVEAESIQGLLGDGDSRDRRKSQRKAELEESLREVADKLIDGMICKLEYKSVIRGAYYICTQLLTRAYHQGRLGIHSMLWRPELRFSKAYMCQAKKSCDCVRSPSKLRRRSTLSSFCLVTNLMSITLRCRFFAIDLVLLCLLL